MNEREISLQALNKVKQLLQDLIKEIEKTEEALRGVSVFSVAEISNKLGEHSQYVDVQDLGELVVVKPKRFLGGKIFGEIQDKLKPLGFSYVSDGRNSRWVKPKEA
jgi:hypothetical protein